MSAAAILTSCRRVLETAECMGFRMRNLDTMIADASTTALSLLSLRHFRHPFIEPHFSQLDALDQLQQVPPRSMHPPFACERESDYFLATRQDCISCQASFSEFMPSCFWAQACSRSQDETEKLNPKPP